MYIASLLIIRFYEAKKNLILNLIFFCTTAGYQFKFYLRFTSTCPASYIANTEYIARLQQQKRFTSFVLFFLGWKLIIVSLHINPKNITSTKRAQVQGL